MKKFFVLMTVLLFMVGMYSSFADNITKIDQSGGAGNKAYTKQIGNDNGIYIKQVATGTGTNTAGTSVSDPILQEGNNNVVNLDQTAGGTAGSNTANINQIGNGNSLVGAKLVGVYTAIDPDNPAFQKSTNGSNTLRANQQGSNNKIGLYQDGRDDNNADIDQLGSGNELVVRQGEYNDSKNILVADQSNNDIARLRQHGGGTNSATINQSGDGNQLGGTGTTGFDPSNSAYQKTSSGTGSILILNQAGSDKAGLYQRSDGPNRAEINQSFGDEVAVRQDTDVVRTATLIANQLGGGNIARLDQNPRSGNHALATIDQSGGNNKLLLANSDGSVHATNRAVQNASSTGDTNLDLDQAGGGNIAGLYQSGTGYAFADIDQSGGSNILGAYQLTTGGYNHLEVIQTGSDIATVVQIGAGNNIAIINQ